MLSLPTSHDAPIHYYSPGPRPSAPGPQKWLNLNQLMS
jgi:hypothetical protein